MEKTLSYYKNSYAHSSKIRHIAVTSNILENKDDIRWQQKIKTTAKSKNDNWLDRT